MNYKLTLLILPLIILFSCSDDTLVPQEEYEYRNYMQLDTGNYWEYESFGISKDGKAFLTPFGFDSTYVIDSVNFNGRTAFSMGNRNITEGKRSTNNFYYSLDSNQIAISGIVLQVDDSLKILRDEWTTIYDLYKGNWFNPPISFYDSAIGNASYNGYISFDGSNQGRTKIEYEGEKIQAFTTQLVIQYKLEQMKDTLKLIDKREEYSYRFAEGIGIIYEKYLEYKDSVLVGGYEKVIQKFNVK